MLCRIWKKDCMGVKMGKIAVEFSKSEATFPHRFFLRDASSYIA